MVIQYRYIDVVDTVSIRGNKLFGAAGSVGEALFPPKPSVVSGAFRSLIWSQNGQDAKAIQDSEFAITSIHPAALNDSGSVERFMPLPSDLLVVDNGKCIRRLIPQALDTRIVHSQISEFPMMPVLKQSQPAKPENGWLLNEVGISAYVQSDSLSNNCLQYLIRQSELWESESRVGIGLNSSSRTVDDGKLFTVEHTVPSSNAGLLVGISGCEQLPESGYLRFGGDGKAAKFTTPKVAAAIVPELQNGQFKMVLQTPALFKNGWLPDGVEKMGGELWLTLPGIKARLVCAAVSRAEVVSGWDIEKWLPKDAERSAPAGSVYWFDQFEGNDEALRSLITYGYWPEQSLDKSRRAEGFNRVLLAAW